MIKTSLFKLALERKNESRPPVWFMRQAGRYHSHYRELKSRFSFVEICKNPKIACEATLGPIEDFDFDAAILFSDLLFPLEAMGLPLSYNPGPELPRRLETLKDVERLKQGSSLAGELSFQGEALSLIRKKLAPEKGLLGFVGGPLTLFFYAVEGTHSGGLHSAKKGLSDGRFQLFSEKLRDLLAANMVLQAQAGADTVAILDTCAGELNADSFRQFVVPVLQELLQRFHQEMPGYPVFYYSKATDAKHWQALSGLDIRGLGVDWRNPVHEVLKEFGHRWTIQGGFDPNLMLEPPAALEPKLRAYFLEIKNSGKDALRSWICGLGHGILPKTPEENVRLFLRLQREIFS